MTKRILIRIWDILRRSPAALLTALGAIVLLAYIRENYQGGIRSNDIHTYWQYARNFLNGHGFSGNVLTCLELWSRGFFPRPVHTILHPVVIAACSLFVSEWHESAIYSTCLFYVMTVPVLFYLARAWFVEDVRIAVLACVFFIFHDLALRFAITGGSDPLYVFLLLAGVLTLLNSRGLGGFALAGIILGLMSKSRPVGWMYMGPLAVFVWMCDRSELDWKKRTLRVIAFMMPAWCISRLVPLLNIHVFGNAGLYAVKSGMTKAHGLMSHSPMYPGYSIKRMLELEDSPIRMVLTDPLVREGLIMKFSNNLSSIFREFLKDLFLTVPMSVLAVVGTFLPAPAGRPRLLQMWLLFCLAVQAFFLSLALYSGRYLYPLMPFGLILISFFLVKVANFIFKRSLYANLCLAVCAAFLIAPFPVGTAAYKNASEWKRQDRDISSYYNFGRFLQEKLPPEMPVLTDAPWLVDVYGGGTRMIALYPRTLSMLERLINGKVDVNAIVLTDFYVKKEYPEWRELFFKPREFLGFVPYVFKDKDLKCVLYLRDSEKNVNGLLARAGKSGSLAGKLRLLARARCILPRNDRIREFALELDRDIKNALPEIKAEFERAVAVGDFSAAWNSAGRWAELADMDGLKGFRAFADEAKASGSIQESYLDAADSENKPAASLYGNTINLIKSEYMGLAPSFDYDFGRACLVDHIDFTFLNTSDNCLRRAEVFTSRDGWEWKSAGVFAIDDIESHEALKYRFDDINVFTRYFRISLKSDNIRPVEISSLRVLGYVPSWHAVPVEKDYVLLFRNVIAGSRMHHLTGRKITDPLLGRKIVFADSSLSRGLMGFGRYLNKLVDDATYTFSFFVRVEDLPEENLPVFSVDVVTDHGRKQILSRKVYSPELIADGQYHALKLKFVKTGDMDFVEPRIYYQGNGKVFFDRINIDAKMTINYILVKKQLS